ncbi:MAG: dihydroorotate dehydrogenase electron transfer subunit [Eubacterium sp.]|nr:dihydroorotate dehydrogenase electron transfer subunit [Eubacterium sp.]
MKKECIINEVGKLSDDVFMLNIHAPGIADEAVPGQFVSVYTRDEAHLLPRPISICDIDKYERNITLVYRVVGYGTKEFSRLIPGNHITIMGPLGNGFEAVIGEDNYRSPILIGGGIGIPPMLALAKSFREKTVPNGLDDGDSPFVTVVLGYRDRHTFLKERFEEICDEVLISTDDGSVGTKGTVIDALEASGIKGDIICACGPMPMLKGVKNYGMEQKIPTYISMEERMACGIGACLGCVCETVDVDDHSKVNNARICKDGPVFDATEIQL